MVGSTNHLDRLDPGISKRPSRFDRKYLFPNPNLEERVLYAEFWRNKFLHGEEDEVEEGEGKEPVEFPEKLCQAIAGITKGFSFAYMQEAFVAALLAIATDESRKNSSDLLQDFEFVTIGDTSLEDEDDDKDLDKYVLWREIKKQIKILREDIDDSDDTVS